MTFDTIDGAIVFDGEYRDDIVVDSLADFAGMPDFYEYGIGRYYVEKRPERTNF